MRVETEQRRQYSRLSVRLPATLAARDESPQEVSEQSDARASVRNLSAGGVSVETSLPLAAGDGVNLTVPEKARTVAKNARRVAGKSPARGEERQTQARTAGGQRGVLVHVGRRAQCLGTAGPGPAAQAQVTSSRSSSIHRRPTIRAAGSPVLRFRSSRTVVRSGPVLGPASPSTPACRPLLEGES